MQRTSHFLGLRRWVAALFLGVGTPILCPALGVAPVGLSGWKGAAAADPRDVLTGYAQAIDAARAASPIPASVDAIETVLGQLRTSDEALLREPLLGMRLARMAMIAGNDPWSEKQLARWADVFATRLAEATIPEGTRARLERSFNTYAHDVLIAKEVATRDRLVARARQVETGIANANGIVAEMRRRPGGGIDAAG